MENSELKQIKKIYGEQFYHFCRANFSTILDDEGELLNILKKTFAPSHSISEIINNPREVDDFIDYIYSFQKTKTRPRASTGKTPEQLFDEAGYILYPECKSEADIDKFKSYYFDYEKLCTFGGQRLKTCRVWFAVKKNAHELIRTNYINPQRQDEYGTSVLSIQFTRGKKSRLSIKNRYNHTVKNPDSTFNNDLDNITPGLMDAFTKAYDIDLAMFFSKDYFFSKRVKCLDGMFYRYNIRWGDVFFCEKNVVVTNEMPKQFDISSTILADNYLIDFKKKKIISLIKPAKNEFVKLFGKIIDIQIEKTDKKTRKITVINSLNQEIAFEVNSKNEIVSYYNPYVKIINKNFLSTNLALESIDLPNVEEIGDGFLKCNTKLNYLNVKNVKTIGEDFLHRNSKLQYLELPNVEQIKSGFMVVNKEISTINLPKVKYIENDFLISNEIVKNFNAPLLESVGNSFLQACKKIDSLDLPNLKVVGNSFLSYNKEIKNLYLPQLIYIGINFMIYSECENISLPKIEQIGNGFFEYNRNVKSLNLPKVKNIGEFFCENSKLLKKLVLPELKTVGTFFLRENEQVKVYAPKLKKTYLKNKNITLLDERSQC